MPTKLKLPSLTSIVGERPKCHYCRKVIGAETSFVEVVGHLESVPTIDELKMMSSTPTWFNAARAIEAGYAPARVFRMKRETSIYNSQPSTRLTFWTGKFHGYGYRDKPSLFCHVGCAGLFGLACWSSGMRMVDKSKPQEDV